MQTDRSFITAVLPEYVDCEDLPAHEALAFPGNSPRLNALALLSRCEYGFRVAGPG